MDNVNVLVEGGKLLIEIDLNKEGTISASGKSKVIASTRGNASIVTNQGLFQLGVNLYKKAK